jgi:cation diffusion facilitator family transporter
MESTPKQRASYRIHHHQFITADKQVKSNMRKTQGVLILTLAMMVIEIAFGFFSSSMALLAEGWHMASHVGALVITLLAYRFATSQKINDNFAFGAGKFLPLGGYTTAVLLAIIAILMASESIQRFFNPEAIKFNEAIFITALGLLVNAVSAFVLGHGNHLHAHHGSESHDHEPAHLHAQTEDHDHHHHHDHDHSHSHASHERKDYVADVNIRSAYLHIMADALTSVVALLSLLLCRKLGANWPDAVTGFLSSLVILRWAYALCRETGWELLDGFPREISRASLLKAIESEDTKVLDLHVWKIAPRLLACEIVVASPVFKGADFYKSKVREKFLLGHITVEEVLTSQMTVPA